jgi:hypothetical protein
MTVDELIEKLSALPPEERRRVVWLEGCDCVNPASGGMALGVNPYPPANPILILDAAL